jgi:hypothetical protein
LTIHASAFIVIYRKSLQYWQEYLWDKAALVSALDAAACVD